jgi:hypothetical protein
VIKFKKKLSILNCAYKLIIFFSILVYGRFSLGLDLNNLTDSFFIGVNNPSYSLSHQEMNELSIKVRREIDFRNDIKNRDLKHSDAVISEIKTLFVDGRLQEGIWFLDLLGYYAESEYYSQMLVQHIEYGEIKKNEAIGSGGSRPYWGTSDAIPVVIKETEWEGSTGAEVFAYHLDRILGLNIVPVTVNAFFESKIRSVQIALRDVEITGINFHNDGYLEEHSEIFILDFLLGHADRHDRNSLTSALGFLVAIDNARLDGIKFAKIKHRAIKRIDRSLLI